MQNVCTGQQLCQRIRTYIDSSNDTPANYKKLIMPAGNEQHNAGDSQDDECRRQIGQCGKKEGRRTIAKGKNPNVPVIQSAAQLIDFCRQHNDDHRLHDLRGLEAHTEKVDPARRAMGAETDQHGQNNGNPCQNIQALVYYLDFQQMIIRFGNQQHECYAAPCENHLPMQIVLGIVQLVLGRIAGGRIHHQHAEARDEQHRKQEAVVIKPLSFFLFFHFTSLICLTPQCLHSASALTQSLKILPRTS